MNFSKLSPIQYSFLFDQLKQPKSLKYNIGGYVEISGSLNLELFHLAAKHLFYTQNILCWKLVEFAEESEFQLCEQALQYLDFMEDEAARMKAVTWMEEDFNSSISLYGSPLSQFTLLQCDTNLFFLYAKMHHIIADAWSVSVIFQQLVEAYNSLINNEKLDVISFDYRNYIEESIAYAASKLFQIDRAFWLENFQQLPALFTRNTYLSKEIEGEKDYWEFSFSKDEYRTFETLVNYYNVSNFHLCLALIHLFLAKVYAQKSIRFGIPILNRISRDSKKTIGPFINVIALAISSESIQAMPDFIRNIKRLLFRAFRHQRYHLSYLKKDLKEQDYEIDQLYDIRVSYERNNYINDFTGTKTHVVPFANPDEQDPLSFHIMEYGDELLHFRIDKSTHYHALESLKSFEKGIRSLLQQLKAKPDQCLSKLFVWDTALDLPFGYIDTAPEQRPQNTILDLLYNNLQKVENQVAVRDHAQHWSYKELMKHAEQVTHYLLSQDLSAHAVVGVRMKPSIHFLAICIGIFKAGKIYCPIDHDTPEGRMNDMLKDANCSLIIVDDYQKLATSVKQEKWVTCFTMTSPIDNEIKVLPEQDAYLLFTSGSTGNPKGILINHGALLDYCTNFCDYFSLSEQDRILQHASIAFDTAMEEIFPMLIAGGELVFTQDRKDIDELIKELLTYEITILSSNPSILELINERKITFPDLRLVISGGDVLHRKQINFLHKKALIYNTYGPTETTICATYHKVDDLTRTSWIGHPIANRQVLLLNDDLEQVPFGFPGEICISGIGLGRYLNESPLTEKAFIEHPYHSGKRLYRTGDIGRYHVGVGIEFLGRKDFQVKLRGQRVELGEIENKIKNIEGVKDALVVLKEQNRRKYLVAYVISKKSKQSIRASLVSWLPTYMIPSHFILLESFPRTISGKVDRQALPVFKEEFICSIPARNQLDQMLMKVWSDVLDQKIETIAIDFFEAGGDSLRGMQMIGRIKAKLRTMTIGLDDLFQYGRLSDFSDHLETKQQRANHEIDFVMNTSNNYARYPLTSTQKRFWLISQTAEASQAYHISGGLYLNGALHKKTLERALQNVLSRHEVLRTIFMEEEGSIWQNVLSAKTFDFSIKTVTVSASELDQRVNDYFALPFDLSKGPLVRFQLFELAEEHHLFVYTLHHIIADGWSMELINRELIYTYRKLVNEEPLTLPKIKYQFRDYVWSKNLVRSKINTTRAFWESYLEDLPEPLRLPYKMTRPTEKKYTGCRLRYSLSSQAIQQITRAESVYEMSKFMILYAVLNIVLRTFSGQKEHIIGVPVAGRNHPDLENMIGLFLNILPLRQKTGDTNSLSEFMKQVQSNVLRCFNNQSFPFEEMVAQFGGHTDRSRSPLFDVLLLLQNQVDIVLAQSSKQTWKDLEVSPYEGVSMQSSQFDLSFIFTTVSPDELILEIEYNTLLFDSDLVAQMGHYFEHICIELFSCDNQISKLMQLSSKEELEIVKRGEGAVANINKDETVITRFTQTAICFKDETALVYGDEKWTYAEVDEASSRMSMVLKEELNIGLESMVGLELKRSDWQVILVLAILKCGGAYVAIDPTYPLKRKEYLRKTTAAVGCIGEEMLIELKEKLSTKKLIDYKPLSLSSHNLAYVMFTSGSTGQPKGVMVSHRNILRLISNPSYVDLGAHRKLLATGSVSFDASTFEYWGMLLHGGRLVLMDEQKQLNLLKLKAVLKKEAIDIIWFTASWFHLIVDLDISLFATLKTVLAGGDKLSPRHIRKLQDAFPDLEIINGYGPTESTTFALCHTCRKNEAGSLPIGLPINGTQVLILNEEGMIVPFGVEGELYIGGDGLARAYLNKPELTSKRFVQIKGKRFYRTGDQARWRKGLVEFCGRKDHQIKLRGYRIELGEIEKVMQKIEVVEESVAIFFREEEDSFIGLYYRGEEIDSEQVQRHLEQHLPSYMIPQAIMYLEKFPLTRNGKIDKKNLPLFDDDWTEVEVVSARDEVEEALLKIWSEVLQRNIADVNSHFFELGGHSLKIFQLSTRISEVFMVNLTVKELFDCVQLSAQAELIRIKKRKVALTGQEDEQIEKVVEANFYPVSTIQKQFWVLSEIVDVAMAYHIAGAIQMRGDLNVDNWKLAIEQLISRHESLRTLFFKDGEQIYQRILSAQEKPLSFTFLEESDEGVSENEIQKFIREKFDLTRGPLHRFLLVKKEKNIYQFFFVLHHIIADGWSLELIQREIIAIYNALERKLVFELPTFHFTYKDYIHHQLNNQVKQVTIDFWREALNAPLPKLTLPTFQHRSKLKTFNGAQLHLTLDKNSSVAIHQLCRDYQLTPFMTLYAGLQILLFQYTGATDQIIGTVVAGRNRKEWESIVGPFLNTLPIRFNWSKCTSIEYFLKAVKAKIIAAYTHQMYPFEKMVESFLPVTDPSRSAFFDIFLLVQNQNITAVSTLAPEDIHGCSFTPLRLPQNNGSQFDLSFLFKEEGEDFSLELNYNTDLYKDWFIKELLNHLQDLIVYISKASSTQLIEEVPLVNHKAIGQIKNWGKGEHKIIKEETILSRLKNVVKAQPDSPALVHQDKIWSYEEVDHVSDQLAIILLKEENILKETFIGVALERSDWQTLVLLAILKTGGVYVPIDISYPQARQQYLLSDANISIIIDAKRLAVLQKQISAGEVPVVTLPLISKDQLMYLMYTSGSTGEPKGVMLPHRLMNNLVEEHLQLQMNHRKVLQFANLGFDVSMQEVVATLSCGGCLYILREEQKSNLSEVMAYVTEKKIETIFLPTAITKVLLNDSIERERLPICIQTIITAGEQLILGDLAYQLLHERNLTIYNHYGPTETHVVTIQKIDRHSMIKRIPSIGKPVFNTTIYILDENLKVLPLGAVGEIVVGGPQVGRGYWNKPELEKNKFIHLSIAGEKGDYYRTGDMGRWSENGVLQYLGRIDKQIKIRGYRVELGEVEAHIQKNKQVSEVAVIVKKGEFGNFLVAYYCGNIEAMSLKEKLSNQVPQYIVPDFFVQMEVLPKSRNGKINHEALPVLAPQNDISTAGIRNELDSKLLKIWSEVLEHSIKDIDADFFAMGGNSLRAIQLLNRIEKNIGVSFQLKELLEYSIFCELSDEIQNRISSQAIKIVKVLAKSPEQVYYPITAEQKRFWILSQVDNGTQAYNMPGVIEILEPIDEKLVEATLKWLTNRHDAFRTVFIEKDGQVFQEIKKDIKLDYHQIQLQDSDEAAQKKLVEEILNHRFDLPTGPLAKFRLITLASDRYLFVYVLHHIITDGWSLQLLEHEFNYYYHQLRSGRENNLLPLDRQYKDYAYWKKQKIDLSQETASAQFWKKQLTYPLPMLHFPASHKRLLTKTYRGDTLFSDLPKEYFLNLKELCTEHKRPLFPVLLSAVFILLHRYTNQYDIIVGCPFSNRSEYQELEKQIGLFMNTLPIRIGIDKAEVVGTLLDKVQHIFLEAFNHQAYSFNSILEDISYQQVPGRNAVYDVLVVMQDEAALDINTNFDLTWKPFHRASKTSKLDLIFDFAVKKDKLTFSVEYSTDLFDKQQIGKMISSLQMILYHLTKNQSVLIQELPISKNRVKERRALLKTKFKF